MPFLGVMLGDEDEQHQRSNVGHKTMRKVKDWVAVSQRDSISCISPWGCQEGMMSHLLG